MNFLDFLNKMFETPHIKYFKNEREGIEILEIGDNRYKVKNNKLIDYQKVK